MEWFWARMTSINLMECKIKAFSKATTKFCVMALERVYIGNLHFCILWLFRSFFFFHSLFFLFLILHSLYCIIQLFSGHCRLFSLFFIFLFFILYSLYFIIQISFHACPLFSKFFIFSPNYSLMGRPNPDPHKKNVQLAWISWIKRITCFGLMFLFTAENV